MKRIKTSRADTQAWNGKSEAPGNRTEAILDAATAVFLEHGYSRASTREIARLAGASKETLYQQFPTKASLFAALMDRKLRDLFSSLTTLLQGGTDPYLTLVSFGETQLDILMSPEMQRLHKVISAEAKEFPELAIAFWEMGPGRSQRLLQAYLANLAKERGVDPKIVAFASEQFIGALLGSVVLRSTLAIHDFLPDARSRKVWAQKTVAAFLYAHFGLNPPEKAVSVIFAGGDRSPKSQLLASTSDALR